MAVLTSKEKKEIWDLVNQEKRRKVRKWIINKLVNSEEENERFEIYDLIGELLIKKPYYFIIYIYNSLVKYAFKKLSPKRKVEMDKYVLNNYSLLQDESILFDFLGSTSNPKYLGNIYITQHRMIISGFQSATPGVIKQDYQKRIGFNPAFWNKAKNKKQYGYCFHKDFIELVKRSKKKVKCYFYILKIKDDRSKENIEKPIKFEKKLAEGLKKVSKKFTVFIKPSRNLRELSTPPIYSRKEFKKKIRPEILINLEKLLS
jgi:hypothetical protein